MKFWVLLISSEGSTFAVYYFFVGLETCSQRAIWISCIKFSRSTSVVEFVGTSITVLETGGLIMIKIDTQLEDIAAKNLSVKKIIGNTIEKIN
ncbi:hypothetical protein TSUD_47170 [Trifolium subterraneum]|nr:hypothetical protein TSUD_47170 [Trifolium subterraneum]